MIQQDHLIEINNLTKTFNAKLVLNKLNLKIPRNKISFIIGKSGEGKSVTLKHIAGLLQADSGEIIIDGKHMESASAADWLKIRRKIGILFQDYAFFDSLTVCENIAFPIENNLKISSAEIAIRVKNLLNTVGLTNFQKTDLNELSIGELKLIALARALALTPNLLLYDEPTTGMDPLITDLINRLIINTQKQNPNLTTVVVSHDISSIMQVADYIFLLHQGELYFAGTPLNFINTKDKLVKQFLTGDLYGPLTK